VTNIVDPTEASVLGLGGVSRLRALNKGKSNLQINTVDKITVTRNSASNTLSEVSSSVKNLLDRLHREVSVSAVNNLEESDLGVTSKVHILCTVGYELHESSRHLYTLNKEKNFIKNELIIN